MDLTGKILVSMPNMLDERFHKAVIYICAHSKEGAMGIIINKQIDLDLYPDLLKQLGIDKQIDDKKIYIRYGGPLETSRGFVLHSDDNIQKDLFTSNKAKELRKKIKDTKCKCTYECAMSTNTFFSWNMTKKMIKSYLTNRV